MGWGGVGLYSRSFNLHTLVMHTPWMLRYSWGGVGWGCVHVQLAHAGDAHAMNATVLMGCCGVGLCSCSFNLRTLVMHTPWRLRYGTHGLLWGGAVFMFLQLAHAGDAHAMNATVLMGWCGVGGVMLTFNWIRTPTWCYAQLLHLHKRCHVGVERFGRLLTVNMIGCNRPRSASLLWGCIDWDVSWYDASIVYIYLYIYRFIYIQSTYTYVYVYVYIYIYTYIYIYISWFIYCF